MAMKFIIKCAIFICCVLGKPVPLTPLTKLVEETDAQCSFQMTANAGISLHNEERLEDVSVSDCKDECCDRDWCKSFDYHARPRAGNASNVCDLSDMDANDVGGLKTDYVLNPYDHYHRNPDPCAEITCTAMSQCHEVGTCVEGVCDDPLKAVDTSCDDESATTVNDVCDDTGVCSGVDPCAEITCTAMSQCHEVGTCVEGVCDDPLKAVDTSCDDERATTDNDVCDVAGVCSGTRGTSHYYALHLHKSVTSHNIQPYHENKSWEECQALCDSEAACVAIEYGAYPGDDFRVCRLQNGSTPTTNSIRFDVYTKTECLLGSDRCSCATDHACDEGLNCHGGTCTHWK